MTAGLYLVLEGPDGGGKSTQAERLCVWLEARGHCVRRLREPGSTAMGEGLRRLLLEPATGELSPVAEALLFFAARAEMIRREVAPALRSGEIVVAERCYLSTCVYQGTACDQPLAPEVLAILTTASCGEVLPDRIFVLDVSYEVGVDRRSGHFEDRIEARGRDYHERVRAGYLELAATDERIQVVDAAVDADAVHLALRSRALELLEAGA